MIQKESKFGAEKLKFETQVIKKNKKDESESSGSGF